jgi:dynein intermediate chain 1
VGTEEGTVHKCSKAYSSDILASYRGHHMAVYAVRWNYQHPSVFLSASADWSVKLWDSTRDDGAVMTFYMNTSVGDVAWASYSSTVFAVRLAYK